MIEVRVTEFNKKLFEKQILRFDEILDGNQNSIQNLSFKTTGWCKLKIQATDRTKARPVNSENEF